MATIRNLSWMAVGLALVVGLIARFTVDGTNISDTRAWVIGIAFLATICFMIAALHADYFRYLKYGGKRPW